uniref:NADH dehydrogenase subunit 4 n=1 Tax=Cerogria janthinipennis TaxID=1304780 RepID=UPI00220F72C4|nr:NADH dehydrogenase subunit 4 [Cerogria janthinipennis]UYB79038.1 NADH dehydrogenase subunit 4 [Cerogria janthinipennis]
MMKILMFMIFMIPLSYISGFWLNSLIWFFLIFLMFMKFCFNNMFMMIFMELGIDILSFSMLILSLWICALMILSSELIMKMMNWENLFKLMVLMLMIFLMLCFSSMNMFLFYIFFESSLIPTFLLIMGWGYQPERLQAGIYLLFYTLFASLPMMIALFFCYYNNNSMNLFFFNQNNNVFMFLLINLVFLIKMPMYFVHLWLPKAHVEAPVSGSMILAGVMLKLGGYGILRFMIMFMEMSLKVNFYIMSMSMVSSTMISLLCLRQSDMKSLIAYSSVSHMAVVLGSMMTLTYWSFYGVLIMMIGHGLCSSGLFCLANISYERTMSRSLYLNKGLINLIPSMSMIWFLFISSNMSFPPSLNLLAEIFLINSIMMYSKLNMIFLSLTMFFSASYSLYLYSFSQHGSTFNGKFNFYNCYLREYLLLILHWIPLNSMILISDYLVLI